MDKSKTLRWGVLLSAATVTAVLSFYPTEDNSLVNTQRPSKKTESGAPVAPTDATGANAADDGEALDPFAPRGWQPPLPPPAPVAAVSTAQAAVPVAPQAPAGPPPLPFKFMGAMNDDGALTIYLSKGEQAMVAHADDVLDGSYKVLALDNQHIDFEYMPTGDKQTLTFPPSEN